MVRPSLPFLAQLLFAYAAATPLLAQPRTKVLWPLVAFCLQDDLAMPQEALPKQAPVTSVVGGYGYTPTADEKARIQHFLSTYDMPTNLDSVVIVTNVKFKQAQFDFSAPSGRDQIAFTLTNARRTFINADLLKEQSPDKGVEWALAHELQHLNDPRAPRQQALMDVQIDQNARDGLRRWKKQQKLLGQSPTTDKSQ